jgi:MFS transporter, DHA3 family, macrolide efflux protein
MGGALANQGFRRIWIGQLVSQIGDRFYAIALALWISDGRGGPAAMAAFLVASTLPALLVGPLAGALADRWSRKGVMISADAIRAAIVAAMAALYSAGALEVWEVVAAAALVSLASAFFNPALSASIPRIVGEASLGEANSLSQLGGGITGVLGPAFGAAVLGFLGYGAVFAFNSASFLVSAALIAASGAPRSPREPGAALGRSIGEGLGFTLRSGTIRTTLAAVAIAHFGMGGLSVAVPFLARSIDGQAAANLGLIEAMMGAGIVAGSIGMSRLAKKVSGSLPFAALSALGAAFLVLGLLRYAGIADVAPYLAGSAGAGLCVAAAAAAWTTCLQRGTPDQLRGRVFGLSSTLGNASLPLGMTAAGFILDRAPLWAFLAPLGACMVAAGAALAAAIGKSPRPASATKPG